MSSLMEMTFPNGLSTQSPSFGLQNLPLELLEAICVQLSQNDLSKFVRTCRIANTAGEPILWRHLIIRNGPVARSWCNLLDRSFCDALIISQAPQKLFYHLSNRPDLARSVREITIPAARMYSNHLPDIINLVGLNLREINFIHDSNSKYMPSQTHDPYRIGLDQVFKSVVNMPRVTRMSLILPAWQWVDCWNNALKATPALQELRVGPLWAVGEKSVLDKYHPGASPPILPSLRLLSIEQMCTALEPAIIHLIKSSKYPSIKIRLADPAGSWVSSEIFDLFMLEWRDRIDVEIMRSSPDAEQTFWLDSKADEVDMMGQERIMELWMSILLMCFSTMCFPILVLSRFIYTAVCHRYM